MFSLHVVQQEIPTGFPSIITTNESPNINRTANIHNNGTTLQPAYKGNSAAIPTKPISFCVLSQFNSTPINTNSAWILPAIPVNMQQLLYCTQKSPLFPSPPVHTIRPKPLRQR